MSDEIRTCIICGSDNVGFAPTTGVVTCLNPACKLNGYGVHFGNYIPPGPPRLSPEPAECRHEWVDARNERVLSGEICLKCNAIRAGNQTPEPAAPPAPAPMKEPCPACEGSGEGFSGPQTCSRCNGTGAVAPAPDEEGLDALIGELADLLAHDGDDEAQRVMKARALLATLLRRRLAEELERRAAEIEEKLGPDVRVGRTWIAAYLRSFAARKEAPK